MKSILVIDDEYDIANALELLLSSEGYQVTVASNGREALDMLKVDVPSMIVMDVTMPVLSGPETLAILRADPKLKSIPVILMSAVRPSAQELDGENFISKPFEIDDLLKKIDELLTDRA